MRSGEGAPMWNKKQRPILVAGGAGFIGINLISHLINRREIVHCADNFSTGFPDSLVNFKNHQNFKLFIGDISDQEFMKPLEEYCYREVYNLACPTGVPNIAPLGEMMLTTSASGSFNLLKLVRRAGAKYLFTSTAEVYGDPEIRPQSELYTGNVDCIGPRSPYEEGKRYAEALTHHFAVKYDLDARIIRVFNTYGPNMAPQDTRVIPQMLANMIQGKRVTIYGDGMNTRTLLYVEDLIAAFDLTMKIRMRGDVYNVGGNREKSVLDLFALCKRVTGHDKSPIFKPSFIEDHKRRLPDTRKIRELGWRPNIGLLEGLTLAFKDMEIRMKEKPMSRIPLGRRSPSVGRLVKVGG